LLLLSAACASQPERWEPTWQAPGSYFETGQELTLRAARTYYDEGKLQAALDILGPLARGAETNLELGFWLQDLEWELAQAQGASTADLIEAYEQSAESEPTPARLILAARLGLETRGGQHALSLLQRALELDPDHPWIHYSLAQVLLGERQRADRWQAARTALARTLELDPSHLRGRHLEAWILAQEGDVARASTALERWLELTRGDPRVSNEVRLEAEVDLALMWVRLGHAAAAEALLSTHAGQRVARTRRLAALAVAQHEQGRIEQALDTARRAELADPGALLPVVQQALLYEQRGRDGDESRAHDRWALVVEAAANQGDLAGLLQSVRARVHLERSAATEATADTPAGGEGGDQN